MGPREDERSGKIRIKFIKEKMRENGKRTRRSNKAERRSRLADLDFKAQLEDFWHLLEKKTRLKRNYLFKKVNDDQ